MSISKSQVVFLLGLLILSCTDWDLERVGFLRIITVGASNVQSNSAILQGDIEGLKNVAVVNRSFVLSSVASSDADLQFGKPNVRTISATDQDTIFTDEAFLAIVDSLNRGTDYYFRAFVRVGGEEQIAYGNIDQFTTNNLFLSINSVSRATDDCPMNAVVDIQVNGLKGEDVQVDLVYSEGHINRIPTQENGITITGDTPNSSGRLAVEMSLDCEQTYFVRAVFNQSGGETIYSDVHAISTHELGAWIPMSDFPILFAEDLCLTFFTENHYGFVVGFSASEFEFTLWKYEPINDNWQRLKEPSLSTGELLSFGCFSIFTDDSHAFTVNNARLIQYIESGDTWNVIATLNPIGPIFPPQFFINGYRFVYNDQLFSGSGGAASNNLPPNNLLLRASLSSGDAEQIGGIPGEVRFQMNSFIAEDQGFVVFGQGSNNQLFTDLWAFDFSTETWEQKADFPEAIESRIAFSANQKGYVLTGMDEDQLPHPGFWEYNLITDEWTRLADFGRGDGTADFGFAIDGEIYGGLGVRSDGVQRQEFWKYIPRLE